MSSSLTSIEELDLEISVAYITLGGAREVFRRCPSAENEERAAAAEAEVNRLLDQRLAADGA